MVQNDGPIRSVYIKFVSNEIMDNHLERIIGQHEFKHANGELSQMGVRQTGLGYRTVWVAGLAPEVNDNAIITTMARYGDIQSIKGEMWANHYPYKVSTGVRYVNVNFKKHVPSQVTIVGYETLIIYDGQKHTCFTCQETILYSKDCPYRRSSHPKQNDLTPQIAENTWAHVVQHGKTQNAPREADSMEHDFQSPHQTANNLEQTSTHNEVSDKATPPNTDLRHEEQIYTTPQLSWTKEHVHMDVAKTVQTDEYSDCASLKHAEMKDAAPKILSKKGNHQPIRMTRKTDQKQPWETPNTQETKQDNQDGYMDTQSIDIKNEPK
jgi:hypothetical protein